MNTVLSRELPVSAPIINYNKKFIFLLGASAALGGLLFGFDLVIISGTVGFFSAHFGLTNYETGWAVGCINIGAAFGAVIAGKLSDRIGRKKLLLICALLFAFTGAGTGWAPDFFLFITFRMLSGVAVGIAALICPMYIAEISPASIRGRLGTFYQLAIVTGLLLAYMCNFVLLPTGINNWRWMFSSQSVPALLFFISLFFITESPRWLIRKNKPDDAKKILTRIGGEAYAIEQIEQVEASIFNSKKENIKDLFKPDFRLVLLIGMAIAFFSQAGGQNSLFSYAPEIFKKAGFDGSSAYRQSILIGTINLIFTFFAINRIEKTGRRKLLLWGSGLLSLTALCLAIAFFNNLPAMLILILVLVFIAIYAATIGPVTWVFLGELFPNKIRGNGMAAATLCLWIANFIATASFPVMKAYAGLPLTFLIHGFICLIYFVLVVKMIPETKGKTLEEIERSLIKVK